MKTQPSQKRSQKRVSDILKVTEQLIVEMPLEDITPTEIAKRAGMTRTSLYHFFPSKYEIFDALASQYYQELHDRVFTYFDPSERKDYRSAWAGISGIYAEFFNKKPAAATLLLGRKDAKQFSFTDTKSNSLVAYDLRQLMQNHTDLAEHAGRDVPSVDIFQIIFEVMTATFSFGMRREGRISKKISEEAKNASLAYIDARMRD